MIIAATTTSAHYAFDWTILFAVATRTALWLLGLSLVLADERYRLIPHVRTVLAGAFLASAIATAITGAAALGVWTLTLHWREILQIVQLPAPGLFVSAVILGFRKVWTK